MYGIISIFWAIFALISYSSIKQCKRKKQSTTLATIWFTLSVVCAILGILSQVFNSLNLIASATLLPIALIAFIVTADFIIYSKKCNVSLQAEMIDYKTIRTNRKKRNTSYIAVFKYYFNGKEYITDDRYGSDKKRFFKQYQVGEYYEIFFCDQTPEKILRSKKIKSTEIAFLFAGLVVLAAYFAAIFTDFFD